MKIDTLIISGSGTNCPLYIGIFHCLLKYKIINSELSNIKEIFTTSIGILISVALLLKYDIYTLYHILITVSLDSLINYDNINIDTILQESGIFDTKQIAKLINTFIYYKTGIKDCTLLKLYKLTKIKLNVRVYNINTQNIEVFNYLNHPNIMVQKLAEMTTSIPFFFKPVKYNENYYLDGGIDDINIKDFKDKKYFYIHISGAISNNDILPLFKTAISVLRRGMPEIKTSRILKINCSKSIMNFDSDKKDKQELINNGYYSTLKHLQEYKLI
jgi:predicted patatin/cPLA2 family phospholipase